MSICLLISRVVGFVFLHLLSCVAYNPSKMLGNLTANRFRVLAQRSRHRMMPLAVAAQSFRGGSNRDYSSARFASSFPWLGTMAALGVASVGFGLSSTALYATCAEANTDSEDKFKTTKLYPPIQAYNDGMLRVSDIHSIHYHEFGNPNGKPVLFVHGGPGGGTDAFMARYFDPKAYRIILVDQRGCGKSTPFADLRENDTWSSIRDFEQLRKRLGIEKWQLFGGSWGSTLALAYAMTHPDVVTELVLRGVFLLREKELDWMYEGKGANFVFPEDWEPYEALIPPAELKEAGSFIAAYGRRLRGELGEEAMREAARVWSVWEGRISKLIQDPPEKVNDKFGDDQFSLAFARIENHYFTNKGFFERDGWLLEDENLQKIRHIPIFIVQGRYDIVCPATSAYELAKKLPHAEIHYTLTGHSSLEPPIIEKLVYATDKYKDRK
jgi:proline iminopeptidase